MSRSDCYTPKDGWHFTRVFNSLFLSSIPSICSEGACMLQGSSDFDSIPVAPESVSNLKLRVGYFCQFSLKSILTASREQLSHNNQFLFIFWTVMFRESCPLLLGHNSREGVLVCVVLGFDPRRGTPLVVWEGGPNIWLFWQSERMPNNQRWF